MISGLKVTVSGTELIELCKTRTDEHRERSRAYGKQIEAMKSGRLEGMQYTGGDPIQSLNDRQKKHDADGDEMDFISKHIEPAESYLLDLSDLQKLGICKSRY
jgi:hypothetical protein